MAGVSGGELLTLDGFRRGINNVDREESAPDGTLRAAVNVDLDNRGKISRRRGYALAINLPGTHSAWSHPLLDHLLLADDTTLYAVDRSMALQPLAALTAPGRRISYDYVAGRVYWSNGIDMGQLQHLHATDWCIEQPGGNPDVAPQPGVGGLEGGLYQVAVTFVHADGRESGATLAAVAEVATGDGLQLTNIPQPAGGNIATVRVYRTSHNGDLLYLAQDLPVGITSFLLGAQQLGRQIETQFMEPLPAGDIVRIHNGRALVAKGRALYWSDSLNYGLYRPTEGYVLFSEDIVLVESVGQAGNATLFVAAGNRTYAITGPDPSEWVRVVVAPYGAVPGGACRVDAKSIGDGRGGKLETTGEVPVWMASDGCLVVGLNGGQLVRLTDRDYVGPVGAELGALGAREIDGINQILALSQGGSVSGLAARDAAEAEVWKDGRRIR